MRSLAGSAALFVGGGFIDRAVSVSVLSTTTQLLLRMLACVELLLLSRLGCTNPTNSPTRWVLYDLTSMVASVHLRARQRRDGTLLMTLGQRLWRVTTAANVPSSLSALYFLGRSVACRVAPVVVMINARFGMYWLWPFVLALIWLLCCSHSRVARCSCLCCGVGLVKEAGVS